MDGSLGWAMCPILRAGFAPTSGNMRGRKGGEGRHRRPSLGWAPVVLMGHVHVGVCGVQLLDLDARNLDFACLGNCLCHVIGELDGVEERLGFFLVLVEVRDEDVDASWFNVGKKDG